MAAITGKGLDGILNVVLLDKNKEQVYVPCKITDYTYYYRYGRFDRYLNEVIERIYTPVYYFFETTYIWESNIFDLNSRQMIYLAQSRTFDIAGKNNLVYTDWQRMEQSLVSKKNLTKPGNSGE
jgi:hypothetical protein